jgi:hypothetical protein
MIIKAQRVFSFVVMVVFFLFNACGSNTTQQIEDIEDLDPEQVCNDGLDDDQDGYTDCNDQDCNEQCDCERCPGSGFAECTDGQIRTCIEDLKGCLDWSDYTPCPSGSCETTFQCAEEAPCLEDCPCEANKLQDSVVCRDEAEWWVDDCGVEGEKKSDCECGCLDDGYGCISDCPEDEPNYALDFCGNQIDEDGDGQDRECTEYQGTLPVVRTVTIYDRGQYEGIRVEPSGDISYPGGCDAWIKIVNRSVWEVTFSGNLTAGWLYENEEITTSVGVPGTVVLSIPHEEIWINLVPDWQPQQPIETTMSGTYDVSGYPLMNAELTIFPAFGQECIGEGNMADSIGECVGYASCTVGTQVNVKLINPQNGELVHEYLFLPDQCNPYGDQFLSYFSWDSSTNQLSIWNHWHNSVYSDEKSLSLYGSPGNLEGEMKGLVGMTGTLYISSIEEK